MKTLPPASAVFEHAHRVKETVEHFEWYVTAHNGATVASDSGTVSVSDAAKGILAIVPSDGTVADNDESYYKGATETLLFADDRPIEFEASVQFAEANTDDANIIVGFVNAVAADLLRDDGAGPKTSFSGCVFYKVDGETVWHVRSSVGTSYTDNKLTATAGGSAYQRLGIRVNSYTSTLAQVTYTIDGQPVLDYTTGKEIVHTVPYSAATEMQIALGVKNGGANLETLNCDYYKHRQLVA